MAGVEKISVALPVEMATLIRRVVASGDYSSTSEVIREALREWKARRATRARAIAELRDLWQEGLASGSGSLLDIAVVKRRGRQRLAERRKPG